MSEATVFDSWWEDSECRKPTVNKEVFYSSHKERKPDRERREAAAKAVCAKCVVVRECLTYALQTDQSLGVWGGTTETERRRLKSKLT